jgi:hypothetical protein
MDKIKRINKVFQIILKFLQGNRINYKVKDIFHHSKPKEKTLLLKEMLHWNLVDKLLKEIKLIHH